MENIQNLITLASDLPESVKANALALLEEINTPIEGIGDEPVAWRPSFLRLVQGTTDRGSIPKDARIGDFVLGEKKLEQPLHFIPLTTWDTRQYWDPDQTSNKMLCWSPDAKFGQIGRECYGCPHAKWKEEENAPSDCSKGKSVMAISSDLSSIFTIQFAKSNFKVGLELETLMKRASVLPYLRTYGLTSATSSTAKNVENYKIVVLDEKLRITPKENVPFLKELFSLIRTDRKASLEGFYKMAYEKRDKLALEAAANPVAALENSATAGTSAAEVVEVKPAGKDAVSPMATNYAL